MIGVRNHWGVKTYWYNTMFLIRYGKHVNLCNLPNRRAPKTNHLFDLTSVSWKSIMDLGVCALKQQITYHCVHTCTERTCLDSVSTRTILSNHYNKELCIGGYTKTIWILCRKLFTSQKNIWMRNYFSFRRMSPSIQDGNQTRRRH